MGLSDEERISKVYYGVSAVVEKLDELSDDSSYLMRDLVAKLKRLGAELWPSMLGRTRNSAYWILGGDADNVVTLEGRGPWSVAVRQTTEAHRHKEPPRRDPEEFDPFEGFLDVAGLLDDRTLRTVYEVYRTTEFITYALRRYDDELSRGLEGLSRVVSEMQGTCYTLFQKNDAYAKAYVLSRATRVIYTGTRERLFLDETGKKLNKLHLHHDLSRPMSDGTMSEVLAFDKELGRDPTVETRLLVALKCAGRRFHYDHKFKELIGLFGKKFQALLEPEFLKCKAAHDAREKESQERYVANRNESADYAIHGESLAPAEPPDGGARGEGWQLWETVSEGSPISPVLPTREAFVDWLVGEGYSREAAEKFTESKWAPSMIVVGGEMYKDVESARFAKPTEGSNE